MRIYPFIDKLQLQFVFLYQTENYLLSKTKHNLIFNLTYVSPLIKIPDYKVHVKKIKSPIHSH